MSFGGDSGNEIDPTMEYTQANIARRQYDDYLRRFVPSENELNAAVMEDVDKAYTDPTYVDVQVERTPKAKKGGLRAQLAKRFPGLSGLPPLNPEEILGKKTPRYDTVRHLADAGGGETKAFQLITGAGKTSDAAFDRAEKALEIQRGRTGFNNTSADATAVGKRRMGLARALANVNAQNTTRASLKDQQLALAGSQIATGRNISQTATGGVATAAQLEAQENARKRAATANEAASTQQAVGTGLGLVAAFLSTEAAKQNIRPVDPEELLALIAQIAPVRFEYKPEVGIDGGFIGMIAEQVPDDFATEDRSKVNGYNLVGALVGAVQALSARVQSLEQSLAQSHAVYK